MVAAVGEINQTWAVALAGAPGGQDLLNERSQLTGQGLLARLRHAAQVERAQAFFAAIVDSERGGAGFLVALLAHGDHDAVTADGEHGAMSPLGTEGLFEPSQGFVDLGGFTEGSATVGQGGGDLAQRTPRPAYAVVAYERGQHLALLVIDGQSSNAFGQGGRGQVSFESQQQIQRKDRRFARFAGLVTKARILERSKGRVDGFGL